ncbi:surface carbohydrate biosynthesis protein [Natrarchaeobius sp. A-rgal3]|uniref:surface carbohydrate biosynthesis protein n=1 Tax=Natrarchaeobius versutus TaxID=1679078 RepID=UPI0035108F93
MATLSLPIETKSREFDGKLWLAINLAQEGHEVAFGDKAHIRPHLTKSLNPDVHIVNNHFWSSKKLEIMRSLSEANATIVGLDTEGGVFPSEESFLSRVSSESLQHTDLIFAWGELPAELIRTERSYPREQIHVTGNPRFDLLHSDLRGIYETPADEISDEHGQFVLINTNFPSVNYYDDSLSVQADENFEYQRRLLDELLESIRSLSTELSEHSIIIRPHPSEDYDFYRTEFKNDRSITIEHSGDVRGWIYASDCVIHNSCTTGIESTMLNVPTVSFEPNIEGTAANRPQLPNDVSTTVTTEDELIDQVKTYVSRSTRYELSKTKEAKLRQYFANVNEQAAPKIASAVNQIDGVVGETSFPKPGYWRRVKQTVKEQPIAPYIQEIRGVERSGYRKQKFPGLSIHEVRSRLRDIEQQVGIADLEVRRVNYTDDVYWIAKQ